MVSKSVLFGENSNVIIMVVKFESVKSLCLNFVKNIVIGGIV